MSRPLLCNLGIHDWTHQSGFAQFDFCTRKGCTAERGGRAGTSANMPPGSMFSKTLTAQESAAFEKWRDAKRADE